jgi:predicted DNA-binding mobile mystery protein A
MDILKQKLLIEQIDNKLSAFKPFSNFSIPQNGWIHAIRTAIRMSMRQLGNRLSISAQSVKELETREALGAITLNSLREAGKAFNMKLIYGFIPADQGIQELIDKRAREIATEIVKRTSMTMQLEDQENSEERIEKAISNRANEIKTKIPKYLWD